METTFNNTYDIFSDLSEDDVVNSSAEDVVYDDNDESVILSDFLKKSAQKYKYTIFYEFSASAIYYKYDKDYIISELKRIVSRTYCLFDMFGIEHSAICMNACHNNDILVKCKFGRVTILNGTEKVNPYKLYNIRIFFTPPDFTFKRSINFIDKLTYIVLRNRNIPLIIQANVFDFVGDNLNMYDNTLHYAFYKVPERPKTYSIQSVINWTFFYPVIKLFFGYEMQQKMMLLINKNKNPFTGKPLSSKRK